MYMKISKSELGEFQTTNLYLLAKMILPKLKVLRHDGNMAKIRNIVTSDQKCSSQTHTTRIGWIVAGKHLQGSMEFVGVSYIFFINLRIKVPIDANDCGYMRLSDIGLMRADTNLPSIISIFRCRKMFLIIHVSLVSFAIVRISSKDSPSVSDLSYLWSVSQTSLSVSHPLGPKDLILNSLKFQNLGADE